MAQFASLPGDFEKQSAILLGCNELLPYHPHAMVEIIGALIERIPLIGIVDSEEQRKHLITLLCDWGLPAHLMYFVSLPVKGMWVRDYGPSFVRGYDGKITILDAEYLELDRPNDDRAPIELAALLRLPVVSVPLMLEGGNMLSNGQGLCITSTSLPNRNAPRGYTQQRVYEMLSHHYGYEEIVTLRPLLSEPTGHVDMFASFVSADTIVVGEYDSKVDPVNADVLNYNANLLANVQSRKGRLKVVRIPMPTNHGSVWRSHTNVIYANGTLLMPTYGRMDENAEAGARRVFEDLLPGWEVIGIDASTIIMNRGALRCVSINIPWLEDRFAAPARPSPMRRKADELVAQGA
jgi:agmatine/peptidylarginine deiminase